MDNISIEDKNLLNTINTTVIKPPPTKTKKKKKNIKKQKEKKCTGLKELLEQINQEKLEKIKLQQAKKKKKSLEKNKEETKIVIQNESEEKNKENNVKDYLNIINSSISGTTVATLSPDDTNEFQKLNTDMPNKFEYNDLKPNYLIKNLEFYEDEKNEEDQFYQKRKFSSPIFDYFDGFDKILSEKHKGSIDMTNSLNFIKKEDFICSGSLINNNSYNNIYNESNYLINPEEVNNHNNNINNYNNNIIIDEKNDNNDIKNIINEKVDDSSKNYPNNIELEKIEQEGNDINISNEDNNYLNIPYSQFMDYYNNIMQENIVNSKFNLLNDSLYNNNNYYRANQTIYFDRFNYKKNKKEKNKYKNFTNYKNNEENSMQMRNGDWLCNFCFNLNFSFRTFCNRCRAPKQKIHFLEKENLY